MLATSYLKHLQNWRGHSVKDYGSLGAKSNTIAYPSSLLLLDLLDFLLPKDPKRDCSSTVIWQRLSAQK